MAKKNVYFFKAELCDKSGIERTSKELKLVIMDILKENATDVSNHLSVDLTQDREAMHLIFDAYEYKSDRLFGRFSKQLPKNTLVHHDYKTYEDSEVLPGVDESDRGIEKYTYGMLDYDTGIWAFVLARGASNENVLKTFVEKFRPGYTLDLSPIPNTKGIEYIYKSQEPEISKIEIEVPLPDREVLEKLYGWSDGELLDSLNQNHLKISTVLKAEPRRSITDEPGIVQKAIEAVKMGIPNYQKAKMVAKAKTIKAREYNFFDDNFKYPIDITDYYIVNYEKIYYTADDLLGLYKQNIKMSFNESKGILDIYSQSE